jgi:hypothetical protein
VICPFEVTVASIAAAELFAGFEDILGSLLTFYACFPYFEEATMKNIERQGARRREWKRTTTSRRKQSASGGDKWSFFAVYQPST